jgi:hypothetical protein
MLKKLIGPALALAAFCAAPAHSATVDVVPDGSWYTFDMDEFFPDLFWRTAETGEETLSFTFTVAQVVALTVVDTGATAGDRFEVFDNGNSLGLTSEVANQFFEEAVGVNPDASLASGAYSFATYLLAAGTHTITGRLAQSWVDEFGDPLNAAVGALRVTEVAPVPLPAGILLLLSGGGALGLFSRRRNRVAA